MQERSTLKAVIFTIITCGLYNIYWMYALTEDMGTLTRDETFSGGKALILTIVTCGIYGVYWYYKMGHQMPLLRSSAEDQGILYLLLGLFGLGIVNMVLIQEEINKTIRSKSRQEVMTADDFEF